MPFCLKRRLEQRGGLLLQIDTPPRPTLKGLRCVRGDHREVFFPRILGTAYYQRHEFCLSDLQRPAIRCPSELADDRKVADTAMTKYSSGAPGLGHGILHLLHWYYQIVPLLGSRTSNAEKGTVRQYGQLPILA